jgi:hypothetical protein
LWSDVPVWQFISSAICEVGQDQNLRSSWSKGSRTFFS